MRITARTLGQPTVRPEALGPVLGTGFLWLGPLGVLLANRHYRRAPALESLPDLFAVGLDSIDLPMSSFGCLPRILGGPRLAVQL